ncbi:MAG: undecaprenyldiphospho-muramoylpentapeptide beta-N-acetylglucosaminyltransferase [Saprospiraceae bacterium]
MEAKTNTRIIISGGGTGGHVFPAIAIADAIKEIEPKADILFVGAQGKIEMEKVPKAGYAIEGLWISGFQRKLTLRNLMFPVKLLWSLLSSRKIIRRFKPQVVVGVGGFASGPLLEMAVRSGIPALIQEQNSYAGVTNKLLGKRVQKVCVAYDGMERFFPADKIIKTGNPVRASFFDQKVDKKVAYAHFDLDPTKKTLFVFGGSLGAASINRAMAANTDRIAALAGIQILWQVGKLYHDQYKDSSVAQLTNVQLLPFVDRMDLAYAVADVVVCRAGAGTISELCQVGQAAILIPSPNVAEDHQTKNAEALVAQQAAVLIADKDAPEMIIKKAQEVLEAETYVDNLRENIKKLAQPAAAQTIAKQVLALI